jgi:peptide/nickel transport system substrate-binding protein
VRGFFKKIWPAFRAEWNAIRRGITTLRFFRFRYTGLLIRKLGRREQIVGAILLIIVIGDLGYLAHHSYLNHTVAVPAYGGTYTEGIVGTPHLINPLLAETTTDKSLTTLVYSGLYKYDDRGDLVPDLAQSLPQISTNQRQYTITLKPNLTWQDGSPLTADDIIFTIQAIQNAAYGSPLQRDWQNTTVKKISDTTIEFDNPDISAPFETNFTLGILPQHLWKNVAPSDFANSSLNLTPVGSGPYSIKEISKSASGQTSEYTFNAFKNDAGGRPFIDTLNIEFYSDQDSALLALHSKQIDGFGFAPFDQDEHFGAKTDFQLQNTQTNSYEAVFFNTGITGNSAVLGDSVVRTALTEATDRESLVQHVYEGQARVAYSPFSPDQVGYDPTISTINAYDVTEANTALDADGWTRDPKTGMRSKNKVSLAFTITTNDFALNQGLATAIHSEWAAVGADVSIKTLSTMDLAAAIQSRSYQALLFSENPGFDPDPFVFWHSSQILNPGLNLSGYNNTTADKLITAARNTLNTATRQTDYEQFQKVLLGDAPAVFLLRPDYVYATRTNVQGMQITQLANTQDRFYDIEHWFVKTKRVLKKK